MDEPDAMFWVAQCAAALRQHQDQHRRALLLPPANVKGLTVQLVGPCSCVVWVVTEARGEIAVSYRVTFSRILAPGPIMSTDNIAIVSQGGIREASYWDIPGNARDLAATAGYRALRIPPPRMPRWEPPEAV